jgi:hypothetical protein
LGGQINLLLLLLTASANCHENTLPLRDKLTPTVLLFAQQSLKTQKRE